MATASGSQSIYTKPINKKGSCGCGCGHDHEGHHDHVHAHGEAACGCGHDHGEHHEHEHHHGEEDSCGCGHHHGEHHGEEEACGCGHHHEGHVHNHEGHDHHHEEGEACGCGHDHGAAAPVHHPRHAAGRTRTYTIENLDCANCAAKMERQINALPGVGDATITFATKQLRLTAAEPDALMPVITDACRKIEDNVFFVEKEAPSRTSEEKTAEKESGEKKERWTLIGGAALFAGVIIQHFTTGAADYSLAAIVVLVAAYIALGGGVVWTAVKNLFKGQVFDENFLMTVATIGAFAIGQYPEAVGVMLFFRIGEFFEDYAVERSRSQIMDAVDLRPEVVSRMEDGQVSVIGAGEARVGDVLLVRPGDRIPLDGVVVDGESRVDTSAVTGEPVPVAVGVGSEVTSGCVNTSGAIQIRVAKVLEESMVTRILDSVENAAASKPKIDAFITRFARVYTPIVVGAAAFTAVAIPLITGQAFYPWIYTALTFLVMSCPCALVLSVPLAFFCGIGKGSKQGILFKGGVAMEALAGIRGVVMDKTGTITKGDFTVQRIVPAGGVAEDELLCRTAMCELTSTHPIGASIVTAAQNRGMELVRPEQIEEISGKGIVAHINGQLWLCGNAGLLKDNGVDLTEYRGADRGSEVLVAADGRYAGQIVIADTLKEEAAEAIGRIKHQHILTAMLTGDAVANAQAVATETGVEEVHAKLLPGDKLSELQKIREAHGSVMFVGDGINDAPVLAGADVGAAMGSGADAAIEAADVVFMNSNMDAIPEAIRISKKSEMIARQNVGFALAVKFCVLALGITGIYANMWLAVFADTGVALLCILNSVRVLYGK